MALIGVYNYTPMLGEVLHEIPIDLWISDVDVYLQEAIEPIESLHREIRSGHLNMLVGREMYLQYIEELACSEAHFNGGALWKDFINSAVVHHHEFFDVGEGPFWEVVAAGTHCSPHSMWTAAINSGCGDLFAEWLSAHAGFVALIENGLLYVFKSDRVGGRAPTGSYDDDGHKTQASGRGPRLPEEGDADKSGDCPTYLLPEWVEDEALSLLEEEAIAIAKQEGHELTPEFIARYAEHQYGGVW